MIQPSDEKTLNKHFASGLLEDWPRVVYDDSDTPMTEVRVIPLVNETGPEYALESIVLLDLGSPSRDWFEKIRKQVEQ